MGDPVTQEDGERDTGGGAGGIKEVRGPELRCRTLELEVNVHSERGRSRHVQGAVQLSREDWLWGGGHSHRC